MNILFALHTFPRPVDMLLFSMAIAVAAWASGCYTAGGARILAVEPIGGRSHWNFMSGVIRALVDRGHHVTAFTPFPDCAGVGGGGGGVLSLGNYTEVDVSDVVPRARDSTLEDMVHRWGSPVGTVGMYVGISRYLCAAIYGHPEMIRLLAAPAGRFDAVLVEPLLSDCVTYAARRLRVPLVYLVPVPVVNAMLRPATGHYSHPAIVSHVMAGHARPDTFARRFANALLAVYWESAAAFHNAVQRRADPRDFDAGAPVVPSLVFVNGHHVSAAADAVTADVVPVGGIHLRPAEPLAEDVLEFIEKSPHGVICFTLGSTVKMSALPENIIKAFIEALAQVPQRVLLKYEDEMENKPKNVMTMKWLPQRDILVHPNVKLFISHGGISGLYEAVDAGVPVLGFPLFADQHRNIDNLVYAGMAICMDLMAVTKDMFLNNVLKLLDDENYMKNAKTASEIFKDRPMSPAEQVVYWTEYVIRHKGAPHLKSDAINLTWYQYFMLDVITVLLIFIAFIVFVVYKILKTIFMYVRHFLRNIKTKSE